MFNYIILIILINLKLYNSMLFKFNEIKLKFHLKKLDQDYVYDACFSIVEEFQ